MTAAGFRNGDKLKVFGKLATGGAESRTAYHMFALEDTATTHEPTTIGSFFNCINDDNKHVLIDDGLDVAVTGILKMDEYSVSLDASTFESPNLELLIYKANVSESLLKADQAEVSVQGEVKIIAPLQLSDAERDELSGGFVNEDDSPLVKAMLAATHKGILTDGENDITFYIVLNNGEILHVKDKIAIKGDIINDDEDIFIYAGEAFYFF